MGGRARGWPDIALQAAKLDMWPVLTIIGTEKKYFMVNLNAKGRFFFDSVLVKTDLGLKSLLPEIARGSYSCEVFPFDPGACSSVLLRGKDGRRKSRAPLDTWEAVCTEK